MFLLPQISFTGKAIYFGCIDNLQHHLKSEVENVSSDLLFLSLFTQTQHPHMRACARTTHNSFCSVEPGNKMC